MNMQHVLVTNVLDATVEHSRMFHSGALQHETFRQHSAEFSLPSWSFRLFVSLAPVVARRSQRRFRQRHRQRSRRKQQRRHQYHIAKASPGHIFVSLIDASGTISRYPCQSNAFGIIAPSILDSFFPSRARTLSDNYLQTGSYILRSLRVRSILRSEQLEQYDCLGYFVYFDTLSVFYIHNF